MSELLPKTGPVPAVHSATERNVAARASAAIKAPAVPAEAETSMSASVSELSSARSSGAADYAKIKAGIADVVARIEPSSTRTLEPAHAEQALMALMPQPVIMLPMPPADPAMIAFVAQVAQSMATMAAQTRAAQANATPLVVEAAAS